MCYAVNVQVLRHTAARHLKLLLAGSCRSVVACKALIVDPTRDQVTSRISGVELAGTALKLKAQVSIEDTTEC